MLSYLSTPPELLHQAVVPSYTYVVQLKRVVKRDAVEMLYPTVCHPFMMKKLQGQQQQPMKQKSLR